MRNWYTMKVKEAEEDDDDEDDDKKKKNPFAEIVIYDAIGASFFDDNAVSAKQFIDSLNAIDPDVEEIRLRINSPGGDVFDGVAIYNALKNHKAKITGQVDGIAASIASVVLMAADKIVMPSNAFMLVHNSAGFSMGTAEDMRALANDLERIDKSMIATYVARTGSTAAKIRALMKEDRLMDAKEAKELGFADEVSQPVKMAARMDLRLLPKAIAAVFAAETGVMQGDPSQTASASQEPVGQPDVPPVPPEPMPPAPEQPRREPGSNEPRLPEDPFATPGTPGNPHPHQSADNPPPEPPPGNPTSPGQRPQTPGQPQPNTTPNQPDPPEKPQPPPSAKVIDINAARQQGIDDHRAYVRAVTDLCTLARAPERIAGFIRANATIEQVRSDLLDVVAEKPVLSQHPLAQPKVPVAAWAKITDAINARRK